LRVGAKFQSRVQRRKSIDDGEKKDAGLPDTTRRAPTNRGKDWRYKEPRQKIEGATAVRLVAPSKLSRKVYDLCRFIRRCNLPLGLLHRPQGANQGCNFAAQVRRRSGG